MHPVGAGSLGFRGSPAQPTVGLHHQARRSAFQSVGEALHRSVRIGGFKTKTQTQPFGHTPSHRRRYPNRGLIQLAHHDVEFQQHHRHTIGHTHTHPVGAGPLGFRGSPAQPTVGLDHQSIWTAQLLEIERLGRQIRIHHR